MFPGSTRSNPAVRLFVCSVVGLFAELALIRFVGSEVRIFAYFNNLILIACFLGFGLGFYRSGARQRLGASLGAAVAIAAVIGGLARIDWAFGPRVAVTALSNFSGALTMGEEWVVGGVGALSVVLGIAWTVAIFVGSLLAMYGYAQRIARDIDALGPERRLVAYSINIGGSLVGIIGFTAAAWFSMPPMGWFGLVVLLTIPFLDVPWHRWAAVAALPILVATLYDPAAVTWSPYQKLTWRPAEQQVEVNNTGYMALQSFRGPIGPEGSTFLDRFRLAYAFRPDPERVLVIGAGGGNDVAMALQKGVKEVVAVEIDPVILELGRRHHPDKPYEDPRVEVVLDDARHYGETTDRKFDLIVFSHLDAHTALSGFTNVRLDNYIHTVESFRTFRRLLAPGGAMYVTFWATRSWVAKRLGENLRLAFGVPPVGLHVPVRPEGHDPKAEPILLAHFVATEDGAVRKRCEHIAGAPYAPLEAMGAPTPTTDDWPYLYVETRRIPTAMLVLAVLLGLVALILIALLIRGEMRIGGGWPVDRHFFFLGAAFLLVEVHNVSKLARVFGTTWAVNAWVIAGVMTVILLANYVAARWTKPTDPRFAYPILIACLVAGALTPVEALLGLPGASVIVTAFYSVPLLFAGLIFARSFANTDNSSRALGSNIFGALAGGFVQLASFVLGLSALMLIAAGFYAVSYPLKRRPADVPAPALAAPGEQTPPVVGA